MIHSMSNYIQFFTSLLSMEYMLKDGYVFSITYSWDSCFRIHVMDMAKVNNGFQEDPCVLQQTTALCFLKTEADVKRELGMLWKRLVKENLVKSQK